MEYPGTIAERMFRWYDEQPRTSDRIEAVMREVSPCSEYTRFTVEGVLRYPMSGRSVIIDVHALGPLFMNSSMRDARWSDRLGYGMAVIGEDTRVHLHGNGKFIIRRALDRDHAESCYKMIVALVKPTLYDLTRKRFLWDILKEMVSSDGIIPSGVDDFLTWPDGIGDPDLILRGALEGIRQVDTEVLGPLRKIFLEQLSSEPEMDRKGTMDATLAEIMDMIKRFTIDLPKDPDLSLGGLSASIWSIRAVDELRSLFDLSKGDASLADLLGGDPWDGHSIDWDDIRDHLGSIGFTIALARAHYLLYPVKIP